MTNKHTTLKKDTNEILKFLRNIAIFDELSTESLETISEKIQIHTYPKDNIIIKKGSPGTCLYLIRSGSARVVSESKTEDFTIATIPSGKCFGEMSLLTGEPCCATVKTNEDSVICFITKSNFDDIVSENPVISKLFNKLLAERINEQNIKSIDLKEYEIALSKYLQKAKGYQYGNIVWKSRKMRDINQDARKFSEMSDPVTIIGKPGTGKEILSRKIHIDSRRSKYPVFEIVLPKERRKKIIPVHNERRHRDNIECELFGKERILYVVDEGKRIGYMELVNNGTLIIKNIENMSLKTQEIFLKFIETGKFLRVGGDEHIISNVRVIVTTSNFGLMQKQLNQKLFQLLTANKLEIPPLSQHKRDIPSLMEHFVDRISKTRHIKPASFSKRATNKLLRYNYPGNVKELENIIDRAITLTEGDEDIEDEAIFLGDTISIEEEKRLNLLKIFLVKRICESPRIILAAKTVILISYILILCLFIIQPGISIAGKNITLILCWQLGVPFLFVLFLFAARFGCGICPMSSISKFINKRVNLQIPIPDFIKKYGLWIMGFGFISILFLEEYLHMASSVSKTSYLIFSILISTLIVDFIFEKSSWCRYICPMGGMAGLFSMSSMIEIRSNKHVCTTICTSHDCFKGSERANPCPMFLHLQFLSDNRYCKVCLNCIKNCPHNAAHLNLRIPGAEISLLRQPSLAGAVISIVLSGLLIAEIISKLNIRQINYPLLSSATIMITLTLVLASNYATSFISKKTIIEHFKHFGYTLIPLILFGFISLRSIDVFGYAKGSLMIFSVYKLDFNFTVAFQFITILTGLFVTEYLIYKIIQNKIAKKLQLKVFIIQVIVPLILSVIYITLFALPAT